MNLVSYGTPQADQPVRHMLMWDAKSQHYIMFMRGNWQGPRIDAPTQNGLLAKLAVRLLTS